MLLGVTPIVPFELLPIFEDGHNVGLVVDFLLPGLEFLDLLFQAESQGLGEGEDTGGGE